VALGHPIVVEALRYKTRTWRQSRGDSIFVRNIHELSVHREA